MRPNVNWNIGVATEKHSTYASKVVKAGIPFASQVTEPDTKYIIKYDFDLGGETVEIPERCILEFDGGSLNNGKLIVQSNTSILGGVFFSCKYPIIDGNDVSNVRIRDCVFTGCLSSKEDLVDESIEAVYGTQSAIRLTNARECSTENLTVSGLQNAVFMSGDANLISNIDFAGIIGTDMSMGGGAGSGGVNYHCAVHGTLSNTRIEKISSRECGECVLLGGGTKTHDNVIAYCTGKYQHDTFIYISSGTHNLVIGCSLDTGCGTGIKFRGSYNKAIGNSLRNMVYNNYGISVTGNTSISETTEYGDVDGWYNEIVGNILYNIAGGISIGPRNEGEDTVYGTLIADNMVISIAQNNYCGIQDSGYCTKMTNNIIKHPNNAVQFGSVIPLMVAKGPTLDNNKLFATGYTIRINYIQDGNISGNVLSTDSNRCIHRGNSYIRTKIINNIVLDDTKALISGTPTGTGEYASTGNYVELINGTDTAFNARSVFTDEDNLLVVKQQSYLNEYGATANRPTKRLQKGTPFYDQTLNTGLHYNGTIWAEYDGSAAGVKRFGTFSEKPSSTDIYKGFRYFCTDKQTAEGATNGIEIFHKGNDVWVDALGRVVS